MTAQVDEVDSRPTETNIRPVRWRRREARSLAWRYLAAVLITGFFLFPIYWLVMISFKTP
jgi:multiple sugar transport system permease protein